MKKTRKINVAALFLAVVMSIGMLMTVASAEELPVAVPSPDKATVSDEKETATNTDPDMGTKFYMYIPPDAVVNDYPQMGDEGISVNTLLLGTIVSGIVYLGLTDYASKKPRGKSTVKATAT